MNDFPWTGKESDPYHPPPSPRLEEKQQDGGDKSGDEEINPLNNTGCVGCIVSPMLLLFFLLLCWSLMFGLTINDRQFTFGLSCSEGFSIQEEE